MDFLSISVRSKSHGKIEIFPRFIVKSSKDLMIRGNDFYAVWNEKKGKWSNQQDDLIDLIDSELDIFKENHPEFQGAKVMYAWDSSTGTIDALHKYCQRQMRDSYKLLDEKLVFSNTEVKKENYSSKSLPYALEECDISAYEELMSTLYSPEERHKLEWAIGSVVSGDSKEIQKFVVLYGSAGTGKSTVLNIIQKLFEGYYCIFSSKALGSSTDSFALEPFKTNPLVAIEHDGDLSRIEDNTRLNSLVSHEEMVVNEKYKTTYSNRFKCMLFMGTNKPVKITDSKSGIIRRLIDVNPTEKKIPVKRYRELVNQINFELGGIALHCLHVYEANKFAYEDYIPTSMIGATNDFYNFMEDNLDLFLKEDSTTLNFAWNEYRSYCEEAKVPYPYMKRVFKEELKTYFKKFEDRARVNGEQIRNYYSGLKLERFGIKDISNKEDKESEESWLSFDCEESIFDKIGKNYPAQYTNKDGTPNEKWENVNTELKDIDTSQLHYVKVPENHIVIDFDIKDESGKSLKKNFEAASKWPPTYAELSKSGSGIHLHYIYTGDIDKLSRVYDNNIEVKVFTGNASLRRKLTKCNNLQISTISSGLPLRKEKKMINLKSLGNERAIRSLIIKNLNKEIHPATKPSIDFISKILGDAYCDGVEYDITDMRPDILQFALHSTNNADYCLGVVNKMKFKSDHISDQPSENDQIIFFDCEVFPNFFGVAYKIRGNDKIVKLFNPTEEQIKDLCKFKLVGFNNRRYDNHILYARAQGYTNSQLFDLSQRIIKNDTKNTFFNNAWNLSYVDVYDFCSTKQGLKKWEIKLGLKHHELGLPWDQPVPENMWDIVMDYCGDDVIATEKVFDYAYSDFVAREILADLSGLSVNDTTNSHSAQIIFGNDMNPQSEFNYVDLSEEFPGYKFDRGTSTYRGEVTGEGGYVYAEPGAYFNVALLDIASMHPSTIINLNLFGKYTKNFKDLKDARLCIKHKDIDKLRNMLDGKLIKYIDDPNVDLKDLSYALKIVINSVYGETSASFPNRFRDSRNIDNIVAKRGSLFMINLKHEVQERGFTVAHIKTDSIKIPDATPEIIQFVMDYGKKYGYDFEHEATYEKMCLVNNAVYIAKYKDGDWTATGTQFQVPYVFKTLFSHEPITFSDMCETKSVSTLLYLDMNENLGPDEHNRIFVGKVGSFCPIKNGCGGGELVAERIAQSGDIKYVYAPGAKGYRWLESTTVETLKKENDINKEYYNIMVDKAVESIEKYIPIDEFVD